MTSPEAEVDRDGSVSSQDMSELTHGHLNYYIGLADRKSSLLLSGLIAYLGLMINLFRIYWDGADFLFIVLAMITMVSIILAAVFAFLAVYPREPETIEGLIFWNSIVGYDEGEYISKVKYSSSEDLLDELLEENYRLAQVSSAKYRNVRRTMLATAIGVIFSFISLGYQVIPTI